MTNIENIRQYGKDNKVPITLDDTLLFLLDVINKNNAKNILEIGTAIGFGCINMALKTNCEHIDTLELDEERYKIANKNIKALNLNNKITTHLVDAREYLENCDKTYDLVYLDGPKGQYIKYLPMLNKLVRKGGVIFADNLNFHGMVTGEIPISKGCRSMIKGLKNYIEEVTTNPLYETTLFREIGDGIGITIVK